MPTLKDNKSIKHVIKLSKKKIILKIVTEYSDPNRII